MAWLRYHRQYLQLQQAHLHCPGQYLTIPFPMPASLVMLLVLPTQHLHAPPQSEQAHPKEGGAQRNQIGAQLCSVNVHECRVTWEEVVAQWAWEPVEVRGPWGALQCEDQP